MIQPDDIRRKAERLYPAFLQAWLTGEEAFFPRVIPSNKRLDDVGPSQAAEQVQRLREGSKEILGYGYSVTWEERHSRVFGRNEFPIRISFESQADFLRYLRKQTEFETFRIAVERIGREFPVLHDWVRSHPQTFAAAVPQTEGLLAVVRYLIDHPRPQLFARELPLPVDSKFIERNQAILRDWLDLILPPQTIRADVRDFERRYGLRYAEPHLLLRVLDSTLKAELGIPWDELSLPPTTLTRLPIPEKTTVFIVENKVNLLTLPPRPRAIALGGLGDNVSILRDVSWLATARIVYWGDIDVEGFEILSSVREHFPSVQSLLMDTETLAAWKACVVPGSGATPDTPIFLSEAEQSAFENCRCGNLRLEQERIDQSALSAALCSAGRHPNRV